MANVKVVKFGGTSVGTPEKIKGIAEYLQKRVKGGEKLCVVVSAMGKETDHIIELANQICENPKGRELDQILVTGEIKTISLLAMALNAIGTKAISLTARQAGITSTGDYQKAKIEEINVDFVNEQLKSYDVLVIAGFQGINEKGEYTTLGRGGSDTSAVAVAGKLGVDCEIYTDVDGIYSTDPRICSRAKKLDYISYEEMNELSSLGAGVMHNRSITLASKYNINVYVGKTLSDVKGTLIMNKNMMEQNLVTACAVEKNVLSTSIRFESGNNLEQYVMELVTQNKINVDMISQVYFEKETNFAFTCNSSEKEELDNVIKTISENEFVKNVQTKPYAKLSLVGLGMRDAYGVVGRVFKVLKELNVEYYQVTTSEISISLLIDESNIGVAVNKLMEEFDIVD